MRHVLVGQGVHGLPPLALDRDQAGSPQHPQVLGDQRLAHPEPLDQLMNEPRLGGQLGDDRKGRNAAPCWPTTNGTASPAWASPAWSSLSRLRIAAALFHKPGLTGIGDLGPVHTHLTTLAGGTAALVFGVALMASGLSSSSVGTYAGRIVMAGLHELADPAAGPPRADDASVADHPGPRRQHQPGAAGLLPDRAVLRHPLRPRPPLLLITRDPQTMTDMVSRRLTSTLMLLTTIIITGLNLYLLYDALA